MGKLDISTWKKYYISDLFVVKKGKRLTKKEMKEGNIRFIGASSVNNGITAYISNDEHLHPNNTITLSYNGSIGEAFYQDESFWASDDVNVLYPKFEMSKEQAFFIIPLLKTVGKRYAFVDKWKKEDMEKSQIPLPINKDGNIDFAYMEKQIKQLEIVTQASLSKMQYTESEITSKKIDASKWKSFHLYDIFDIDSGTKLDKVKMGTSAPEINFVGRSNLNNGVALKVNRIMELPPYDAGNLTLALGGSLGSCFVQEEPFYTSQNVVVLKPKKKLTFEAKQFIATTIFRESQNNYKAFIKELNAHIKRDFAIKLPVSSNEEPDYDYMSKFMEERTLIAQKTINYMSTI